MPTEECREQELDCHLSKIQSTESASGCGDFFCLDSHLLQHADEQVWQRVVPVAIECDVLSVFEAAARN